MIYTVVLAAYTLFLLTPTMRAGEQEKKSWQVTLERKHERQRERQGLQHQNSQQNLSNTPQSNTTQLSSTDGNRHHHHDIYKPKWAIVTNAMRIMMKPCVCTKEHHPNNPCQQRSSHKWQTCTAKPDTKRLMIFICACPEQHNPTQPCQPRS